MAMSTRKSGAYMYFSPKSMATIGCDRAITAVAAGTVRSAPYFTENWNMLLKVSFSFCASSLEKTGNSTVDIGTEKKVIRTAKFNATW